MFKDSHAFNGYSVNDLDAAEKFYRDTLGLDVWRMKDENMDVAMLKLATGGRVLLYSKGDAHEPATFTVLNFPSADVDTSVDELIAKGVRFERYPEMSNQDEKGIARGKASGQGPDIGWFKDPAGNILAVLSDDPVAAERAEA
jgi:catechol 2,3-dioxygenase-like lactoylglutathione lyase family enzyme